jgi:hypothetical protein
MTKQLLNEEIGRILEIMGTSQSTINESIGDDVIRNILRKLGKPIGRNTNPVDVLKREFRTVTKENFNLLLNNELKIFADTINKAVSKNKSEDEIINKLKTTYGNLFDDAGNFERYLRNRIQKRISKSTSNLSTNTVRNMPYKTADELINSSIFQREINKFGLSANQIKATKDVIRKHFKEIGLPRDVNEFNEILKGFMKDVPPKKLNLFEKWKEGMYLGAIKQFGTLVFVGVSGVLLLSFLIQLIDCIGDDDSEELFDANCVTRTLSARIVSLTFSILKGVKQGASKAKNNSSKESEEGGTKQSSDGPTPGTLEHFKKTKGYPDAVEIDGKFYAEPDLTDIPDAAWVWNKDENRYE